MRTKKTLTPSVATPRKRREVLTVRRTDDEWYEEIKTCLTVGGRSPRWGCLSKQGKLFRIATLSEVVVPRSVMENMLRNKELVLNVEGAFYKYIKAINP